MNFFGGMGNYGRGENCCCTLIWLLFLLQICGCDNSVGFGGNDCMGLIFIILLLSCCGCHNTCGNN